MIDEVIEWMFLPTNYIHPIKQFCLGDLLSENIEDHELTKLVQQVKNDSDKMKISWPAYLISTATNIYTLRLNPWYFSFTGLFFLMPLALEPDPIPKERLIEKNRMLYQLNQLLPGWKIEEISGTPVYEFLKTISPTKRKVLIDLLRDQYFPIVQKEPTLVIIAQHLLNNSELKNATLKLTKKWSEIETIERFEQSVKNLSPHLNLSWSFATDENNGSEALGFIGTTNISNEQLREHVFKILSDIENIKVKQEFSTITVRGFPSEILLKTLSKNFKTIKNEPEIIKETPMPLLELQEKPIMNIKTKEKIKTKGIPIIQKNHSTFFKNKDFTHIEWNVPTHLGLKSIIFTEAREKFTPEATAKYLFSKNNVDYYGLLDLTEIPGEYHEAAKKGFEKGYIHKSKGNCISEANPEKDGCSFKIRTPDDVRIKPYSTTHTHPKNHKKSKLLYFCVFDNKPHNEKRSKKPNYQK